MFGFLSPQIKNFDFAKCYGPLLVKKGEIIISGYNKYKVEKVLKTKILASRIDDPKIKIEIDPKERKVILSSENSKKRIYDRYDFFYSEKESEIQKDFRKTVYKLYSFIFHLPFDKVEEISSIINNYLEDNAPDECKEYYNKNNNKNYY